MLQESLLLVAPVSSENVGLFSSGIPTDIMESTHHF